ncbi:MAG: hypothetical protein ACYTHJ_13860 [Planctomycetota bacterium]|jgi:hypothetical protein
MTFSGNDSLRKLALVCLALQIAVPLGLTASSALASEASSSALAGSDRYGNRHADASASYDGDVGFANTRTTTGLISTARGVAVGFDEEGLSLSVSNAISGPRGQAAARNLNLSIGTNGQVAVSGGRTNAQGTRYQSAQAGGGSSIRHGQPNAFATAGGNTDRRGVVQSDTFSRTSRAQRVYRQPRTLRGHRFDARPAHRFEHGKRKIRAFKRRF